jgi:hypothetical protein
MSFDPTDRYYTVAQCGCEFDHGQWFPCAAHQCPHDQHETKAPWCDECYRGTDAAMDDAAVCEDEYLALLMEREIDDATSAG